MSDRRSVAQPDREPDEESQEESPEEEMNGVEAAAEEAPQEIPEPPIPERLNTHPEIREFYCRMDMRTGQMMLNHPHDLIWALGLAEMMKAQIIAKLRNPQHGSQIERPGVQIPPGFDPRGPKGPHRA